jgi:hypothetical protein
MVVLIAVLGCVLMGAGISNVRHAGQLIAHGVTVHATVAQNHGFGQNSVLVHYFTATGHQEEGVLNTPAQAATYQAGSRLTVVYDPASPSIVTLPGSGNGGWAEVVTGGVMLAVLALAAGGSWLRRRRQAVRGPGQ